MTKRQLRITKVALLSAELWRLGLSPSQQYVGNCHMRLSAKELGEEGKRGNVGKLEKQRRDFRSDLPLHCFDEEAPEACGKSLHALSCNHRISGYIAISDAAQHCSGQRAIGPLHAAVRDPATEEQAEDKASAGR